MLKAARFTLVTTVVVMACLLPVAVQGQTGTLFVEGNRVGVGTDTPNETLHVTASNGSSKILVEETGGSSFEELMELFNEDGNVGFRLRNADGPADFNKVGNEFRINLLASPPELRLDADGNLIIRGSLTTENPAGTFPDFVFDPGHQIMPLDELRQFIQEERHLPGVMSADEVAQNGGVDLTRLQLQLLEKVEELTLHLLDQNETIEQQQATIRVLQDRLEDLEK